jgi:hypothetical protein
MPGTRLMAALVTQKPSQHPGIATVKDALNRCPARARISCGIASGLRAGGARRPGGSERSFPLAGRRRTALARSDHVTVSAAQFKTEKAG